MGTEKLYYQNPYTREFTARVISVQPLANGRWNVVLDQTAFYPESGGQPADHGTLSGVAVRHVREEQGLIIHEIEEELSLGPVEGTVDWQRRFDHMQQHSGEHILCGAFNQLLGTANVGFHLGEESSQIDLAIDSLSATTAENVEQLANSIIYENRLLQASFVSREELGNYRLRKELTKEFTTIRLVDIHNFDCCPCGGTHVARTGEVGLIKIRSWERKKSGIRVDFVCGGRALRDYREKHEVVSQLSARLSAGPTQLLDALERVTQLIETQRLALKINGQELNKYKAQELVAKAPEFKNSKLVTSVVEGVEATHLNELATQLVLQPRTVALLAGISPMRDKVYLLFARSPELELDLNQILKSVLPSINGRGGGTTALAQGGGPGVENAEQTLIQAEVAVRIALQISK